MKLVRTNKSTLAEIEGKKLKEYLEEKNTMPYSVTTRKNGCEVWVSNDNWDLFIGECYEGTPDNTIADVMRKAQIICNALNKDQMEVFGSLLNKDQMEQM